MRYSDAFSNVKNLAVRALQLSAAVHATAQDTPGAGALVPFDGAGDRVGHHAFLPHRDGPSRRMPLPLPAAQAGRKLASVGTGVTSVSLNGCPNSGYTAEATVGGGAKVFGMHLLVDTASCDAVLASTACTDCNVSPVYNATLGRAENEVLQGTWGSATWSGLESIDQINLGPGAFVDTSLAALTQQNGVFGNAGCQVGNVPNTRQGLLGVGPIALSTSGLDTGFFWAVSEQEAVLALSMCDEGGYLFLGAEPLANTDKSAFYTPLVDSKYYAVEVTGIAVGNTKLAVSPTTLGPAIISSSNRATALPQALYNSAIQAITSAQTQLGASFFSNQVCVAKPAGFNLDVFPAFSLSFASAEENGAPSTMNYGARYSYLYFLSPAVAGGADLVCPGLASSGTNGAMIMGNTLMRDTMTTINWYTKMVTIGPSTGICS